MTARQWSPEYTAFANAHGRDPQVQLDRDTERWPGGKMCGFILWMGRALRAFKELHPEACVHGCIVDHDAKVKFLRTFPGAKDL
jgi:hypothetical protein